MTEEERRVRMSELDTIRENIQELAVRMENQPRCRCGERGCLTCQTRLHNEYLMEDLEISERAVLIEFPEIKYADDSCTSWGAEAAAIRRRVFTEPTKKER